jgi:hypothetical protein
MKRLHCCGRRFRRGERKSACRIHQIGTGKRASRHSLLDCRQPLPYRITEGFPVIRPESLLSAKITSYNRTSGPRRRSATKSRARPTGNITSGHACDPCTKVAKWTVPV